MKRISSFVLAAAFTAALAFAAAGPPLAGVWNIAPTGSAGSSGDLLFRVSRGDGSDPVEITVPVHLGADQASIARSIRSRLSSQLGRGSYQVQLGDGGNILVSDPRGLPNFSVELLNSDVDGLRVAVQSVTPAAAPTVPAQYTPAVPPATPPAGTLQSNPSQSPSTMPGTPTPPPNTSTPAAPPGQAVPTPSAPAPNPNAPVPNPSTPVPNPATPVPSPSMPVPNPSPPPNATGGAGAPASAPPPNAAPSSPPGSNAPAPGASAPPPAAAPPPR